MTEYDTIAEAEAAIIAAGYVRDNSRHVWVNNGDACKVVRTETLKFVIQDA